MKKRGVKKIIAIFVILISGLVILDYINLPSLLGFKMSNINWEFCMGLLSIAIVLVLYSITYKALDKRTIEREKNKSEISTMFIDECYLQCIKYIKLLNQEMVEEYIVPKINFNSTNDNNTIITNLQNSPFINENLIMDLVKDGQINKEQIEAYYKIREKYSQYVTMRIIFFDAPHIYEPLRTELCNAINIENKKRNQK